MVSTSGWLWTGRMLQMLHLKGRITNKTTHYFLVNLGVLTLSEENQKMRQYLVEQLGFRRGIRAARWDRKLRILKYTPIFRRGSRHWTVDERTAMCLLFMYRAGLIRLEQVGRSVDPVASSGVFPNGQLVGLPIIPRG